MRRAKKLGINVLIYFCISIPLIATIFLIIVFGKDTIHDYNRNMESKNWLPQSALVATVSIETIHIRKSYFDHYYPKLWVTYNYQNNTYANNTLDGIYDRLAANDQTTAEQMAKQQYPIGSPIQIIVDPSDPKRARTINFLDRSPIDVVSVIFMIFAFGFFFAYLYFIYFFHKIINPSTIPDELPLSDKKII